MASSESNAASDGLVGSSRGSRVLRREAYLPVRTTGFGHPAGVSKHPGRPGRRCTSCDLSRPPSRRTNTPLSS